MSTTGGLLSIVDLLGNLFNECSVDDVTID